MKLTYNAPVILTFAILTIVLFLLNVLFFPSLMVNFFAIGASFSFTDPFDYFRVFSHVLGHADGSHLLGNMMLFLLLGPILEEKYGSRNMLWIIVVTAFSTGIINLLFSTDGMLGSSGIVFAFIILVSIVNVERNTIPLSFVIVSVLFIGNEILSGLEEDLIAQSAHIVGGAVGAVFGFRLAQLDDSASFRT
jgi:GlpG protein